MAYGKGHGTSSMPISRLQKFPSSGMVMKVHVLRAAKETWRAVKAATGPHVHSRAVAVDSLAGLKIPKDHR
jgi:hypothetical protein